MLNSICYGFSLQMCWRKREKKKKTFGTEIFARVKPLRFALSESLREKLQEFATRISPLLIKKNILLAFMRHRPFLHRGILFNPFASQLQLYLYTSGLSNRSHVVPIEIFTYSISRCKRVDWNAILLTVDRTQPCLCQVSAGTGEAYVNRKRRLE